MWIFWMDNSAYSLSNKLDGVDYNWEYVLNDTQTYNTHKHTHAHKRALKTQIHACRYPTNEAEWRGLATLAEETKEALKPCIKMLRSRF